MDKITNFIEIQNAIKAVKDFRKGFITNFFPEVDKINSFITQGLLYKKTIGETTFILRENQAFCYLYFCSTTDDAVKLSLSQLDILKDKTQLVVDIIGKYPDIQSIILSFEANGFYLYTSLNRMSRSTTEFEYYKSYPGLIKADLEHASVILNLLNQYFDPLAEQLPTLQEINDWIKLNHLIIVAERGEIQGFIIFDIIGFTSYLRYWFVHPQHRNKKIGSILINEFFKNSVSTKRQLFWVIQSNENAINRYLHYGFKSENLFDYVLTNKNEKYETTNN